MALRTLGLLEVPTPQPTRGGLLPVATVIDSPNNEFMHQTGIIQGTTCEVPEQAPYDCFANLQIPDAPKDSHGIFTAETTTFSLYFAVDCYLQADEQEFIQRARDGLLAGESTGIEKVGQQLLNQIALTDSAENIVDAIGKAELYAGNHWGHLPLIHMDRLQATRGISEHVLFPGLDWTLTTGQGTPVDNGGGFVEQNTIWVTGSASLMRGPISTYRAVHPTLNREFVLAERSYALWIDCGGLKVSILAPGGTGSPPGTPLTLTLGSIPSSPIPDGTDVTAVVQTNVVPQHEIYVWYRLNGGPATLAGEATQVDTLEFVFNADESITVTGDSVEAWAVTEYDGAQVESNHITIQVV